MNKVSVAMTVACLCIAGSGLAFAANVQTSPAKPPAQLVVAPKSNSAATNAPATTPVRSTRLIREAQQDLKSQGLYKGHIDGLMGPKTKRGLAAFQQENGLKATGELNQQTLAALNNPRSSASAMTGTSMQPVQKPHSGTTNSPAQLKKQ